MTDSIDLTEDSVIETINFAVDQAVRFSISHALSHVLLHIDAHAENQNPVDASLTCIRDTIIDKEWLTALNNDASLEFRNWMLEQIREEKMRRAESAESTEGAESADTTSEE